MLNLLKCSGENCKLFNICDESGPGECDLKRSYTDGIQRLILKIFPDLSSEPDLELRAKYHLYPLYQMLLAAYIEYEAYNAGLLYKFPTAATKAIQSAITLIEATLLRMEQQKDKLPYDIRTDTQLGYYERLFDSHGRDLTEKKLLSNRPSLPTLKDLSPADENDTSNKISKVSASLNKFNFNFGEKRVKQKEKERQKVLDRIREQERAKSEKDYIEDVLIEGL